MLGFVLHLYYSNFVSSSFQNVVIMVFLMNLIMNFYHFFLNVCNNAYYWVYRIKITPFVHCFYVLILRILFLFLSECHRQSISYPVISACIAYSSILFTFLESDNLIHCSNGAQQPLIRPTSMGLTCQCCVDFPLFLSSNQRLWTSNGHGSISGAHPSF